MKAVTTDIVTAISTDILGERVNAEHRLARQSAETAVQHAIRCGELLSEQKARLPHGTFGKWIADNCEFSQATANNYMRASKNPNALGNSIRSLFPSGASPSEHDVRKHSLANFARRQQRVVERHDDIGEDQHLVASDDHKQAPAEIIFRSMTIEMALDLLKPMVAHRGECFAYIEAQHKIERQRRALARLERDQAPREARLIEKALTVRR